MRVVLGPYPSLSLVEARERAREALSELSAGINPIRHKAAQRAAEARVAEGTVEAVAEDFIRRHAAKRRTGVAIAQLVRREIVSRWGSRPIAEITRGDVTRMVEEIADKSPSAARQSLDLHKTAFRLGPQPRHLRADCLALRQDQHH